MRKFAFILLISLPETGLACYAADDVKYKVFEEIDANGDDKISYEELYDHQIEVFTDKKNFVTDPISESIGFSEEPPEDIYQINENFFKIHWKTSDKNHDGFWSAEEFMQQNSGSRCELIH